MVYVNSKKFACQSCIKGHRSSSCCHSDRPLFEIKKKGRPVSQCDRCRELRHSRKLHSKCSCGMETQAMQPLASSSKSKRYIPIAPTLPNGLRDAVDSSSAKQPADYRQLVNSLLNPCSCRSLWHCKCSSHTLTDLVPTQSLNPHVTSSSSTHRQSKKRRPSTPKLPPIQEPILSVQVPTFSIMPPISAIASFAGSGCTCGVECGCPGCEEHRGPEHVNKKHKDCRSGCGNCVDNQRGIALPGYESQAASNIVEKFLKRAASLPAPPSNRKMGSGTGLDPMNIITYPQTARETEERATAFGLISLPKLECCGGKCRCPSQSCSCGKSCDGCCSDHSHVKEVVSAPLKSCCSK